MSVPRTCSNRLDRTWDSASAGPPMHHKKPTATMSLTHGGPAWLPVVLHKAQETPSSSGPVDLVRSKPTASGRATLVGSAGTA